MSEGGDGPTYTDYALFQEVNNQYLSFFLDGGSNTPIVNGTFWRITDNQAAFSAYFGVAADAELTELSLFDGTRFDGTNIFDLLVVPGTFVDRYGDSATTSWNYVDGWAYRNDGDDFGNEGAFVETNWSIIQDAIAGCTENGSCSATFPLGTYSPTVSTTSSTMSPPT